MNMQVNHADKQAAAKVHETIWLLGQPSLEDSLASSIVDLGGETPGARPGRRWRVANDYYYDLRNGKQASPTRSTVRPVDKKLQPISTRSPRTSAFSARSTLSDEVRDGRTRQDHRLAASHRHHPYRRLQATLGPNAGAAQLLQFCQRVDRPTRRLRSATPARTTISSSTSSDFRFNEAKILSPEQFAKIPASRRWQAARALRRLQLKFPQRCCIGQRMVLHNGHHRAYALRGVRLHPRPCIVQTVTRVTNSNLVASRDVVDESAFFPGARPPLLKDFFDPIIRKMFLVRRSCGWWNSVSTFANTRSASRRDD